MYKYSKRSLNELAMCHSDLQALFNEVIKHFDTTIIVGHRSKEDQDAAYEKGLSKLKWPQSKHNKIRSEAVDAAPFPIDWKDTKRFYYFAGYVKGIADRMGIDIRCGADWDGDNDLNDQKFMDLVHFELILP